MEMLLASPRGFCAGVDRAIEIVERALELFGEPIYVRHEVVHNRHVVNDLKGRGAVFVESLDEIPDQSVVIFSAHGVGKAVRKKALSRGLRVFDATCPLVTKVHFEVVRYRELGLACILIGHKGHPEVEGTLGQVESGIQLVESVEDAFEVQVPDPARVAYVTQTTLSVDEAQGVIDALKSRFPKIKGPRRGDICFATQNRQDAVRLLATECEVVFVVGSSNSSNSNRLKEIVASQGVAAYLVDGPEDIRSKWLEGVNKAGITAGASAPEEVVKTVVEKLKMRGVTSIDERITAEENLHFSLPNELKR
ncbi:MAG: 4-hydroxy-3-methylbut-2-enyl diphosphate reductase [Arenicellales bacterium]|jgi:4-hydroxy-3-methylbut-2-enyl diphosphate reductase|nr:4-hydroxy-3-methylbut-2-enyl diphosphate reductase [Arenicellales bacterium]MDP7156086.1 4-hydroxy-3-methylbut-2-enyl diphosphate reductase [Arenicellales bacterium]MDP7284142.1 4-hydroxy-3-methylbut-2-enyl diphosphate reductase [Arenicellales bacterium]HJL66728.1 4-hydroxy-3-methylbut-2-enyl diphosphate reductase [Arenicellales bacterium]